MSEIPEQTIGHEDGVPIRRRVMTREMIEERLRLNVANTASSLAARAAEGRARLNGHSNGHSTLPDGFAP